MVAAAQPHPVVSREPSYRRMAGQLREEILRERYAEGEALPTDLELGEEHGVSRQTVRRAYQELVNEGLVFRVPGRGTFITPKHTRYRRSFASIDDLLNLRVDTELEVLHALAGSYHADVASMLQLSGRAMYTVVFRRFHLDQVLCMTTVHLPPEIGRLLEYEPYLAEPGGRSPTTVIGLLDAKGVRISQAVQMITAVAADAQACAALGCPEGAPLLHIERLYSGPGGHPVEYAVSDFLPEHYSHRLHLGRRSSSAPSPTAHDPEKGNTP